MTHAQGEGFAELGLRWLLLPSYLSLSPNTLIFLDCEGLFREEQAIATGIFRRCKGPVAPQMPDGGRSVCLHRHATAA